MKMNYETYLNKVRGCFLGKALSGNAGAPYEGMKQELHFEFSEKFFDVMLPNDDLDLQVLWLDVLERRGGDFSAKDLADIFFERCPYAPGEYALFKRNYEKGIYPPLSGSVNARMFANGMGSTIRSEIWASVCPCDPARAVEFASIDSRLDHPADSGAEHGERFFAALESLAYGREISGDEVPGELLESLISEALVFIPEDSRVAGLVKKTVAWCAAFESVSAVRSRILREYGDAEATGCFQNIGFILLSLLKGLEAVRSTMIALNCGFDTDCTCATAGAVLGILLGGEKLKRRFGVSDAVYRLGVNLERRSDSIDDLGEDVARVGAALCNRPESPVRLFGAPDGGLPVPAPGIGFDVKYVGANAWDWERKSFSPLRGGTEPSLGFGESRNVVLVFCNRSGAERRCRATLSSESLRLSVTALEFRLGPGEEALVPVAVSVDAGLAVLPALLKARVGLCSEDGEQTFDFGFCGGREWAVYGPYWRNIAEVPRLEPGEGYWGYLSCPDRENFLPMDCVRHYHMNCLPDESERNLKFFETLRSDPERAEDVPHFVRVADSEWILEDFEKFDGQACYYWVTKLYAETERSLGLQVGYTDTFKFWLNGELLLSDRGSNRFTCENMHKFGVTLRAGENTVVVMLVKVGEITRFSFDFVREGACSDHVPLGSVNLQKSILEGKL